MSRAPGGDRLRLAAVTLVVLALLTVNMGPVAATEHEAGAEGDAEAIALAHLDEHKADYGLTEADIADLVVTDVVPATGGTVVHFQQRHRQIGVYNAITNVVVSEDGEVLQVGDRFEPSMAKRAPSATPGLSDVAAAEHAARALGLRPTEPFTPRESARGNERRRELSDGGISRNPIPVHLVWQPREDGSVRLAWDLTIYELDAENWWQIRIDARSGDELDRNNYVVHEDHEEDAAGADAGFLEDAPAEGDDAAAEDPAGLDLADVGGGSYRAFDGPVEAPTFGDRTLVSDPAHATASPYGWHDTNGAAGAEHTTTRGNNVHAYTDTDDNNSPDAGSSPDGGAALSFDSPLDLTQHPSTYRPASVTNLFYWNNLIHDVFYRYGFTEASGNFQVNNYGKGGVGGDDVMAESQDGGGINNANFAAPPDGQRPRMQMYLGDIASPTRDGSFDNGVVVHEYGHGISIRLTGGPSNSGCLSNDEQAGEGWSDYMGLAMTQRPTDTAPQARGIGTYLFGQPANGPGIRAYPYSTSMTTDPRTYDSIKTAAIPHGVGSVFAAMLWEVHWALTAEYGFSSNLITGTGGNTRAIQLVVDGLKLQPCSPGFVNARDAILLADQNNGGQDRCLLWEAFAKRGLGVSATQGSSGSRTDGIQAFDVPASCRPLDLSKTATPSPVEAGGQITYQLTATNNSPSSLTGVSITDPVPAGTSFVPGSATCGGTLSGGVVTFPVGTLASGANTVCSFKVAVAASPWSTFLLEDGFDAGAGNWTTTHGGGTAVTWALTTTTPHSPPNAMLAPNVGSVSDQYLTTAAPVAVAADTELRFMHSYATENGYDGGVVEVSTNNGTSWTDLGPHMTENGYSATLSNAYGNPLGGRAAFSGDSGGYIQTVVDLSSYAGQSVHLRFRLGTDDSVSATGWRVDDVLIGREVSVTNAATASATGVPDAAADVTTRVVESTASAPAAPTGVSATATGATSARVTFTPGDDGGSPITSFQAQCVSSTGGTTRSATGAASPIDVTNLTTDATYRCRVRATNAVGTGPYSAYSGTFVPGASGAVADFTGDGMTDLSFYRPSNGRWFVRGVAGSTPFGGVSGDVPVPADYTGDGTTDFAIYRPGASRWFVHGVSGSTRYGLSSDVPVPGDYDGDGTTGFAIYRPGNGRWFVHGVTGSTQLGGVAGDVPVPGDYDGDGATDFAVYRPGTGRWYVDGVAGSTPYGVAGDVPVPGDYDGDGATDFAIYRPSNGRWFVHGIVGSTRYGLSTDVPMPGDYDGDGTTDVAIYRPSNGRWFVHGVTGSTQYGTLAGDRPLPLPHAIHKPYYGAP